VKKKFILNKKLISKGESSPKKQLASYAIKP